MRDGGWDSCLKCRSAHSYHSTFLFSVVVVVVIVVVVVVVVVVAIVVVVVVVVVVALFRVVAAVLNCGQPASRGKNQIYLEVISILPAIFLSFTPSVIKKRHVLFIHL